MSGIWRLFQEKIGRLTSWPDPLDKDFAKIRIDKNVVSETQQLAVRHRCSQRLGKGLFFTDEEKQKFMDEVRQLSLP